jgi:hypothetical protein
MKDVGDVCCLSGTKVIPTLVEEDPCVEIDDMCDVGFVNVVGTPHGVLPDVAIPE